LPDATESLDDEQSSQVTERQYPPGWNMERVEKMLKHREARDEPEAVAQDETGHSLLIRTR
jgi:hypothetical protein